MLLLLLWLLLLLLECLAEAHGGGVCAKAGFYE
jgi:hypothetical protein